MQPIDIPRIKKAADYVRYLSLECIEKAKSGHPGLPLGCAELGVVLYRYVLSHTPADPSWLNRDRFVLSAGHGSMLLYSLLYLTGYPLTLDDLKRFRQRGSRTPGHPEFNIGHGVETTTGPLGQGFANAVGMAIEGKILARRFNETGFPLFDYTVFTLTGDGCNMEGLSYEAASLAGHLGLDNLVAIYDANRISIDGSTDITFSEDVAKRYEALGWQVEQCDIRDIKNGKSLQSLFRTCMNLKRQRGKPKMLIVKTTIGEGLDKKRDSNAIHGAPAGIDEIVYFVQHSQVKSLFEAKYGSAEVNDPEKLTAIIKQRTDTKGKPDDQWEALLDSPQDTAFMRAELEGWRSAYGKWNNLLEKHKETFPEKHAQLEKYLNFSLPDSLKEKLLLYRVKKPEKIATRSVAGKVLNMCAQEFPQMVGGSADLAESTYGNIKSEGETTIPYMENGRFLNRNIAYGVREHAMGSVGNGLALGRRLIPFSATFFTFFDYMKPSVRLAAMMKLNHLFIFSHDSIYVGEDGPTHQPIEHLNALRLIPDILTFRPANDMETAFAFLFFLEKIGKQDGPVCIVTSRQKLSAKVFGRDGDRPALYEEFKNGAYVFYETERDKAPDVTIAASGSEVALAYEAAGRLEEEKKVRVRLISIPCLELLAAAKPPFQERLWGERDKPLVLIEAASHRGVNAWYDRNLLTLDIQSFGISAPGKVVGDHFGFTVDRVCQKIKEIL
jgi:transketolase